MMETPESRPRPPNPAMPYREDCWSEGATEALLGAWGGRYIELNRGNLRQKDWQEVAAAVNSRPGGARRPPRTDVQCKNRIDTLKKKYKAEKARVSGSGGAKSSQWQFYSRLDGLIGSITPAKPPTQPASPPMALPLPVHRKGSALPVAAAAAAAAAAIVSRDKRPLPMAIGMDDSLFRRSYMAAAAAAAKEEVEDGTEESESSMSSRSSKGRSGRGWKEKRNEAEGDGVRELARAIELFAEVYERVEEAKQQHMIEMERKRMEFGKGLEVQRMQMFVDCQVQMEKIKRRKRADPGSYS